MFILAEYMLHVPLALEAMEMSKSVLHTAGLAGKGWRIRFPGLVLHPQLVHIVPQTLP